MAGTPEASEYPDEHVWYVRPPALPGVEILAVDSSPRLWRVYHDTYSICTVLNRGRDGVCEWRYRGRDYSATKRSLMMMEPGELHVTKRLSYAGTFRVLLLNPSVVQTLAHDSGQSNVDVRLRTAQESAPSLFRAFAALHDSLESDAEPLETQERYQQALSLWLERCTETRQMRAPKPAARRFATAIDYLHAHHTERLTLDELAAVAGVTPWHLLRMFRGYVGCTPHRYVLRLRMTRARRLLRAGPPPANVASALGFSSEATFVRHFEETWGVTPARYAQLVLPEK